MCVFEDINYRLGGFFLAGCVAFGLAFPSIALAQDDLPPPLGEASEFDESAFGFEEEASDSGGESYENAVRRDAFNAALEGLLPLRPEEIRTLLERFDRTQESVELPVYPAPKPEIVIENIDLDPGAPPLALKLAYGHVSTISFIDASGRPWPIQNLSWAGNFQIVETKMTEGKEDKEYSSKIIMSPSSEFAFGNISIDLLGLDTPIIMTLETSRDIVYYRFDAVIPEYGPLAKAPIIQSSVGAGLNAVAGHAGMSAALEGIVPPGAIRLDVSGVDGRTTAFSYNGMTYVRTPLSLLSPGWSSSVSASGGMRVYELSNAPVLLLSDKGRMVRARVSNREDIFDE